MPNTKPDLFFDKEGVCDACRSAELKYDKLKGIDWDARKKEFEKIIERYRSKNAYYDCIIPVSGGKDSHFQTYMMKVVYKMNPLLVCFEQTKISELGRKNMENIRKFGCDMIYFLKNPDVYRKLEIEGLKRVGDNDWPNHLGCFTIPVRVAVQYNIPLIIWGENSQLEYGGPAASREKKYLDRRWMEEFTLLGNRVEDMIGVDGITKEDMVAYTYPEDKDLKRVGVTGLFLGYFFLWDQRKQVQLMRKKYGFNIKEDGTIEGTYTNYENLDDATVGLHDYLKFTKYGFGRATDHACTDIRNNRISREEGLELVRKYDGKYPYYGVKNFCEMSGMAKKEVDKHIDRFTNKQIFKCDKKGDLIKDIAGNLIKNNYDNEN